MFQFVVCHFEVILCFLTNRKSDFFQVHKSIIQVVQWHLKIIFCLLKRQKFDLGEVEKAMNQLFARYLKVILVQSTAQIATFVNSRKRCFKESHVILNAFSAS